MRSIKTPHLFLAGFTCFAIVAPAAVADAFCAGRLDGDSGHVYGTLPPGLAFDEIIERARPKLA